MAIGKKGWELHIVRKEVQTRRGRTRTIGEYQVYRDGVVQERLKGTSVETKGPGDNAIRGNGRCIVAGRYPLATQAGSNYVTLGYKVSDDPDQTPKPGIELLDTGNRSEILVHPGHGFLASIGCINLTSKLSSGNVDIPFIDSRKRVIACLDDLKAFCGDRFPHYNGQPIKDAWVVIEEAWNAQ